MTYDGDLADRIRELVAVEDGYEEKRMFGGLAFLIGGHLAIAASGQGGALVRADPSRSDALIEKPGVQVAVMRGRPMLGWLRVDSDHLRTKRQLAPWVKMGVDYARTQPTRK